MAAQNGERASQVRVNLKARDSEIELPVESQGSIVVSTDVKRYQLSTLVNKLLGPEKPIPFEFLINGQFLRTSLDEFLTQNGISAESTLNVEYVKALVPPLHVASYEHDEWVSSVDISSNSGAPSSRILSGSFDGSIRIWDESSQVIATGQWHRSSVQSVKFITTNSIASAGNDRSIRIWDFENSDEKDRGKLTPKLELLGHKSIIDRIVVHAPSSRILSASSDHTIGLWTSSKSSAPAAPESSSSNKRRKLSGPAVSTPQRGALSMLTGHQHHVKDVSFDARDATVAYSGSMDHTIKTWDLATSTCVTTIPTTHSIFSICHLPTHSLLAAGNTNNTIDLIDLRSTATKLSSLICIGHTNWIRSISPSPSSNTYQFVSASSDSTCKIWDLRSTSQNAAGNAIAKPVYTIERESQKGAPKSARGSESAVFGVVWDEKVGIVSGGEDKRVQINRAP
ncbi:uncharacterized protein MYCFIDRAFT_63461 [Pseudocercospora fijiensis CIRAD86]|uniref:Ribosome biogenesis protein YTM1 n=1 Tax=Pseudocercospora fijiensis (strain CIRAD86) TaxID=383855 RepID=M2ZML5_PSEFD|nr:uncharacterized protein MYCFIDRAFT_63461 [Pseudocercospora fijiensis CIRAD86]EME80329.1 hypothetical protein MYCFIDRAFT_63461 [Pseudocercospora fijiensis CIRAD86]